MTGITWSFVDAVSQLLDRDEREVVRGDLAEAGANAWHGLVEVFGLVIRRQAEHWKAWRPWLAAFGLALPASFLLMGFSLFVSRSVQQFKLSDSVPLVCYLLLLIGWSWTGGFVVGSVSPKTVWVSAALTFSPCLFCLARFRHDSVSRFCLLLFLLPAVWGVTKGLQNIRIHRSLAIAVALAITLLTISTRTGEGSWLIACALTWPVWYMVAKARVRNI